MQLLPSLEKDRFSKLLSNCNLIFKKSPTSPIDFNRVSWGFLFYEQRKSKNGQNRLCLSSPWD
jgi:hypothetical protein